MLGDLKTPLPPGSNRVKIRYNLGTNRLVIVKVLLTSICSDLHDVSLDTLLHVSVGNHGVGEDDAPGGTMLILEQTGEKFNSSTDTFCQSIFP